jgi:hypothetical protein
MQFSLRIIQLIILISSSTLASDYAFPLHLVSRQSGFECLPVFLLYPDTWKVCGSGYISPDCSCCNGGLIGCLTLTQTCTMDATGEYICCDNSSPNCSQTPSIGEECEAEGKVYCGGNGCLPAGYGCCPNVTGAGCSLEQHCCSYPDGTPACCATNSDISTPSNTAASQSSYSPTSPTSEATPTSKTTPTSEATPTPTESFNFGTGSSTTTSAKMTSDKATSSTTIPGSSSSTSKSSSTRVYMVRATRDSYSFSFQSAMPFIVICYFLLVGIFA